MEKVLSNIRGQPGFEDFLQAPDRERIQNPAMAGPVVIINVSQYRCDAILVERHDIRSLALSNSASRMSRRRHGRVVLAILERWSGCGTLLQILSWKRCI